MSNPSFQTSTFPKDGNSTSSNSSNNDGIQASFASITDLISTQGSSAVNSPLRDTMSAESSGVSSAYTSTADGLELEIVDKSTGYGGLRSSSELQNDVGKIPQVASKNTSSTSSSKCSLGVVKGGAKEFINNLKSDPDDPSIDEKNLGTLAKEVSIRKKWLTFIDSTQTPFLQLLTQIENHVSTAVVEEIKEDIRDGGMDSISSVVDSMLQEDRPIEAAGFFRLLAPDDRDIIFEAKKESISLMIVTKLASETYKQDQSRVPSTELIDKKIHSDSVLAYGLNILFNKKLLKSPAFALTPDIVYFLLDQFIASKVEVNSEDFQTFRFLLPTPYSAGIAQRMLKIALNTPRSSKIALEVAEVTLWPVPQSEVVVRFLCEAWKTAENSATQETIVNILKFIKEQYSDWFNHNAPEEVASIFSIHATLNKIYPFQPISRTPSPPGVDCLSIQQNPLLQYSHPHPCEKNGHNRDINNHLKTLTSSGGQMIHNAVKYSANQRSIPSPSSTANLSARTPLSFAGSKAPFFDSVGNLLNPIAELDPLQLFDSRKTCLEMICQCQRHSDCTTAVGIMEAFIEKFAQEGFSSIDYADVAVKGLLRVFGNAEDLNSAMKTILLLEQLNVADGPCYALLMQMCCRAGKLPEATEYMELVIKHCMATLSRTTTNGNQLQLQTSRELPPSSPFGSSGHSQAIIDWMAFHGPSVAVCLSKAIKEYFWTLIDLRHYEAALDFIVNIIEIRHIQIDCVTVTQILAKLLKSQPDRRTASRLLEIILHGVDGQLEHKRMVKTLQNMIRVDESFFTVIVDCCVKFRSDDLLCPVLECYRNQWHKCFTPDVQTCGVLIKALGASGRVEDCWWIFWHATEAHGVEPSEVTYGCMLDALVNNGRVEEAVSFFEDMKLKGKVRPNTIMYSTIVKGYAQEKQLDKALAIHDEMKSKDVPINTVTYNTLVDACARVGAMDKAAALLDDMLTTVEPDLITFSTIAKGYCVQGDVERAMQLLAAMRDRGIRPDGILYNSLLDGCVRALRPDLCEQLWQQMQSSGIPPSNFTLTILIKMFGRAGKLNRAFEAVRQLPKRYGFNINAHVYTCLMSACITNKEFSKALEVFECMRKDDVVADAKTYETVLFGTTRWGNYPEALRIVSDAFNLTNLTNSDPVMGKHGDNRRPSGRYNKRVIGFQMDTRNFKNLWTAMKEAGEFELAIPVIRQLVAIYGSSVHNYLPPGFSSPPPPPPHYHHRLYHGNSNGNNNTTWMTRQNHYDAWHHYPHLHNVAGGGSFDQVHQYHHYPRRNSSASTVESIPNTSLIHHNSMKMTCTEPQTIQMGT